MLDFSFSSTALCTVISECHPHLGFALCNSSQLAWIQVLPAWCVTFQPTLLCPLSCSLKCWLLCSGKVFAGAHINTKFLRCAPSNCISNQLGAFYSYQCPLTCFCEYHVMLLKTLLKSRNTWTWCFQFIHQFRECSSLKNRSPWWLFSVLLMSSK